MRYNKLIVYYKIDKLNIELDIYIHRTTNKEIMLTWHEWSDINLPINCQICNFNQNINND